MGFPAISARRAANRGAPTPLLPRAMPQRLLLASRRHTARQKAVSSSARASMREKKHAFAKASRPARRRARASQTASPPTGSYIGLFQLSRSEFKKYGSGDITSPRDNAIAAAYKLATEGALFEQYAHREPTVSDLYLIHQQGWRGAAEHVRHPERIAWKSMCATDEGRQKGERWCKRAIWGNTPSGRQTCLEISQQTNFCCLYEYVAAASGPNQLAIF